MLKWVLGALALVTFISTRAWAAIYWADYYGEIGRVELDGSNPTVIIPRPVARQPTGLKIVGNTMYWGQGELLGIGHNTPNGIRKANLDGSNITTVLETDDVFWSIDVSGSTVYFNSSGSSAGAGNVSVSGGTPSYYGEPEGESLVSDAINDLLFYQVFDGAFSIRRRPLTGGPATTILTRAGGNYVDYVAGFAVDPIHQHLYFTDSNNNGRLIKRANYDGSGVTTIANVGGTSRLYSIDLDIPTQTIYYGEQGGRIGRVNFDGTSDTQIHQLGPGGYLYSIEVIPKPAPAALSANALLLVGLRRRSRSSADRLPQWS